MCFVSFKGIQTIIMTDKYLLHRFDHKYYCSNKVKFKLPIFRCGFFYENGVFFSVSMFNFHTNRFYESVFYKIYDCLYKIKQ